MDEEEREREIGYYSNDGNYIIDSNRHELHLYVFEEYTDKGGAGEITLYTDKDEAVRAAEKVKKHTPKTHTPNTKNGSGTTR